MSSIAIDSPELIDDWAAAEPTLPAAPIRSARPVYRSRGFWLAVTFAVGLLIGWLVVGWWLWPVEWTDTTPAQLGAAHQRAYVRLVADNYWYSSDLAQAERSLAAWDRQTLIGLIQSAQREATDVETRQRLATLAAALNLPGADRSLTTSLLSDGRIWIGLALAALPLAAAAALIVAPLLRKRERPAEAVEAEAEEFTEGEPADLFDDVQIGEEAAGSEQPQAAEEKKPGEEEQKKEEEARPEEEEEKKEDSALGDLASLFAEEDTSLATLEKFSKGMADINVDEMLAAAREIVRRLQQGVRRNNS